MHIHVHRHMYTHIRAYVHIHVYACAHTHACSYTYMCTRINVRKNVHHFLSPSTRMSTATGGAEIRRSTCAPLNLQTVCEALVFRRTKCGSLSFAMPFASGDGCAVQQVSINLHTCVSYTYYTRVYL